ncbi:hypothetical protein FGE12_10435 [Aggregicoccus sp. 17bor-14]|uniref:hypothetical protein n=1 Tax=Myxococcaceae TaxID=31 RepID=UPI00129C3429|nr:MULTISPECIES: hypothetical protein [Myxococcaceae]MBF5042810.1 hypothetical protein [Simulacricoccus sp. 17bor-14]MRI88578.1 hypothetical protein [Aggregicoccus sp. 17bor-14]
MSTHSRRLAAQRGTTLVEAMIAMGVVLVGLLGFASLQIITSRANVFNKRMAQATTVAQELAENMRGWPYADSRLSPGTAITSLADTNLTSGWDLGRAATPSPTPQFSDSVLTAANYRGLALDADRDGTAEFTRYWNVYAANLTGGGQANGKLIQIIVRWKEPGLGFRQVTTMAYKPNPQAVFQ